VICFLVAFVALTGRKSVQQLLFHAGYSRQENRTVEQVIPLRALTGQKTICHWPVTTTDCRIAELRRGSKQEVIRMNRQREHGSCVPQHDRYDDVDSQDRRCGSDGGASGGLPPSKPSSINRATIAAREQTLSLAKSRLKYVQTVQELISSTAAMVLFG
jgi:hypothetical protein